MQRSRKTKKRSRKLLKWIQRYGGYWYLICTPGDSHMNMVVAKNIINSLAKNGLDEMIFVFLTVHRNEEFVKHMLSYMTLDLMLEEIKHKGLDQIVRMIDENLR